MIEKRLRAVPAMTAKTIKIQAEDVMPGDRIEGRLVKGVGAQWDSIPCINIQTASGALVYSPTTMVEVVR